MIKSMTGYGRGEANLHGRDIVVELRGVNNRYLDCTVKMPRSYIFAEDAIKSRVQKGVSRGKVDVFISIGESNETGATVVIDQLLVERYLSALRLLGESHGLQDDLSLSKIAQLPDVVRLEKEQADLETITADLVTVTDLALGDFDNMRLREGGRLAQDILERSQVIVHLVGLIEEQNPNSISEYRARLERKMAEVLANTQLDESRILTEAAIFADKVAVDEETVRLRSHLSQLTELLAHGGATGRKLDFLIQEFNREANTIGSKCSDIAVSRHVVDMKSEIEKIREQVQNIE